MGQGWEAHGCLRRQAQVQVPCFLLSQREEAHRGLGLKWSPLAWMLILVPSVGSQANDSTLQSISSFICKMGMVTIVLLSSVEDIQ